MYNRYIPQGDGTYRKNRMEDSSAPRQKPNQKPPNSPPPDQQRPSSSAIPSNFLGIDIGSFFRNLIPRNLDTGDLLVIVLLLLMAGDCSEDKSTSLLTLALYLFM